MSASVSSRRGTRVMWSAGLVVALGAGVLTAHGLIQVALGSGVPVSIGWLYPVITDGLALVAYAATTRLGGAGQKYAWVVVVLAAGLSAVAQAAFLAGGATAAPAWLRSAVGAWPAVAAAITAHLLFLIGSGARNHDQLDPGNTSRRGVSVVQADLESGLNEGGVRSRQHPLGRTVSTGVQAVPTGGPVTVPGVQVDQQGVQRWDSDSPGVDPDAGREVSQSGRVGVLRPALSPGDRALAMGELQRRRSGSLPSVRELAGIAEVSRGTAETALRQLREQPAGLHLVDDEGNQRSQP